MSKLPYPMRSLKVNEGTAQPVHIICVDAESDLEPTHDRKIKHHFKMGVAVYWRRASEGRKETKRWLEFSILDVFWEWVTDHVPTHGKMYLFSHNIDYDLATLNSINSLTSRGWYLVFLCGQRFARQYKFALPTVPYAMHLRKGGQWGTFKGRKWQKTLICLDSMNLMRGSIAAWGSLLNLSKLSMPGRTTIENTQSRQPPKSPNGCLRSTSQSTAEWRDYNRRDVEILLKMVEQYLAFLKEHNLGNFKYTIAGQAFTAYRHRFMQHRIFVHTHNPTVLLERRGYFGGRVEPFYIGSPDVGPIYKLDVNSMYPFLMREQVYPVCLIYHSSETSIRDLEQRLQHHCVMADCSVRPSEAVFPHRLEKRNVYPIGRYRTVLSTPEIAVGLEKGWITKVHEIAQYSARPIFREYVDFFYQLKVTAEKDDDPLTRAMIKLYMNSLYGKFGQKGYEDKVIGTCDKEDFQVFYGVNAQTGEHFTDIHAGGTITRTVQTGEGRESFVAVAAHVTAFGRMYLWSLMQRSGSENVYYVDTDSLCVNQAGFDNLIEHLDDHRLGALKIEAVDDHPTFRAPKDYEFGGSIKRKGIPHQAARIGPNRYEVLLWPSMVSLWQRGITDHYENDVVDKRLSYVVNWGTLSSDGRVSPYSM